MMECYNLEGGSHAGDDPQKINILETEGSRDVTTCDVRMDLMNQPLKIRKVKIVKEENQKFENIGDYWDEETMAKITNLLHEFQELFPTNFSEMKETLGDLGEMKISFNPYVKPVKQWPYRMNP